MSFEQRSFPSFLRENEWILAWCFYAIDSKHMGYMNTLSSAFAQHFSRTHHSLFYWMFLCTPWTSGFPLLSLSNNSIEKRVNVWNTVVNSLWPMHLPCGVWLEVVLQWPRPYQPLRTAHQLIFSGPCCTAAHHCVRELGSNSDCHFSWCLIIKLYFLSSICHSQFASTVY